MAQPNTSPARPKPFSVRKGSVVVKGYPAGEWGGWRLSWYAPDGSRQRKAFKDEGEARRFAAEKAAELSGQRSHVRTLTPEEAADYEAAVAKLPSGVKLVTAVDFYVSRHPAGMPRTTVSEAVQLLLSDLDARGMSGVYQRVAKHYLEKFAESFSCPIADLNANLVREWLRGLGAGAKTQRNVRGLVVRLFNHAAEHRLISRELALEISHVKAPKVIVASAPTLTPADLLKLLNAATPEELPAVALLAFCPLRTAEVARMDWRDIRLAERVAVVNASAAKLSVRRVSPIAPAGVAWLTPHVRESGPVWPVQPDPDGNKLSHRLPLIAKAAGVAYSKNCLRHSIISALVSLHEDAARVSLWAGNSPRIVASNYSARWTRPQGESWLAVVPDRPANVASVTEAVA